MRKNLNCPNCGAPITGIKCEYCGTMFFNMADIEIGKAGYIRVDTGRSVDTLMAIPTKMDVRIEPNNVRLYGDNEVIVNTKATKDVSITLEFQCVCDTDGIYLRRYDK